MLNVGVIGAGRIGRLHVNYLKQRKDINLKWISDLFCDKLDDWIKESNNIFSLF